MIDERTELQKTADEVYARGDVLARARGAQSMVIVVAEDGAFQMRSGNMNVNVAVGVLSRAMVLLVVGFKDAVPSGEVLKEG